MKARLCRQRGAREVWTLVSYAWNYLEERGLTRCSTAWWMHERKEATLFPFRGKSESPEIAHICERKTAGYFPSLDSNVDFVDSARSLGLSRGRKARGTGVHYHAESERVSSSQASSWKSDLTEDGVLAATSSRQTASIRVRPVVIN